MPRPPVRVLHVVAHFGPAGTEVGVSKLANLSDRALIETSICSSFPAPPRRPRLEPDVTLHELNRRRGHDPRLIASLRALFRQTRPDIVHTHGWGTLCEGLLAARLAGVPAVIHGEHGTMEIRRRNLIVQRWVWSRVNQVLSVSSRLAERMAATVGFPRDAIRVIRNGVDLHRFAGVERDAARQALHLGASDLAIGSVGRFQPVKDHANLLQACARLHRRGHPHVLVLAGMGPLREQLEQLAADLGIHEHVRFLGHRRDVEWVLAALDVFALPSKSEGLSNTIQEAMAAGVPVVATHVGGADELVQADVTGQLVPAQDPDALAGALADMLSDEDRRRHMGAAGRRRAEAEMSIEHMVTSYERLYLETAGVERP